MWNFIKYFVLATFLKLYAIFLIFDPKHIITKIKEKYEKTWT